MRLHNATILITGGARRLGLALAASALDMGYDVILHYRSSAEPAKTDLAVARAQGRVCFLRQNLTPQTAPRLIEAALKRAPRLNGLVNNAAVFTKGNLRDLGHLRATMDTNAMVPCSLATAFAACVGSGWIINMTDANIASVNQTFQNYRISKLLLAELTRQLAVLLAPGIRVNAIAPGAILPSRQEDAALFRRLARTLPLRRTNSMQSLTEAFEYLASAAEVTGQTMFVDNGYHLTP